MAINPPWPGLMRGDGGNNEKWDINTAYLVHTLPLELGGAGKLALDEGGGHKTARIIIVNVI